MRRALVTGGSGIIGAAICRRLAGDGLYVIVHGHRGLDRAEAVAATVRKEGGSAEAVAFDLTDHAESADALAEILVEGPVQVLVHNAGIHDDAPLAGMTQAQWQRVIDVSLNGFFNVTQPLLLAMIRSRWGRIVSISSVAAMLGNRGQTNYAAAKAGLHGASRALALELASRGITVNVVAPGVIATPETDALFPPARIEALVPMKRAGRPEEVAELVGFLASDKASYVTGEVIAINGGMG